MADKFIRNEFEQFRWPERVNFMDEVHKSSPTDGLSCVSVGKLILAKTLTDRH